MAVRSASDPLLVRAAELVVDSGIGSAAMLQRNLRVGYERGRQLMAELEAIGVVGPVRGRKGREVKVRSAAELEELLRTCRIAASASASLRPSSDVPTHEPVSAAAKAATALSEHPATTVVDDRGAVWEPVPVTSLEEADTIQFGDIASAIVIDGPQLVRDDFDGAEVVRLVIEVDGGEEEVDLTEDDAVYRRAVAVEEPSLDSYSTHTG